VTTDSPGIEAVRRQQRLIFRCVMEFLLDEGGKLSRRHDGDFVRGAVFLAIAQATRMPDGAAAGVAVPRARTISVRAISQSLALPYETTRRKVAELEALGLCRRVDDGGLAASPAAFAGEAYDAACRETWLALRGLIVRLRTLGFDFGGFDRVSAQASPRADGQRLAEAVAVLGDDFLLRVLEAGAGPHGSILNGVLATAMLIANAELVTHDPQLAWKYAGAETPPPDSLRRPATVTELATRLGFTHETVRRRVKRFVELGWARRVTGGYLYSMARQQTPEVSNTGLMTSQRFLQLLQALRQLGVDPATVEAG
jgi:DNA-binding Lrp family transcriptional regulator